MPCVLVTKRALWRNRNSQANERKNMNEEVGSGCILIIMLVVILAFIPWHFFKCHQEAETFNKFKKESQPTATMWDAFFSELRVTP